MKKKFTKTVISLLLITSIMGFSKTGISQTPKIGIFDESTDIGTCLIKGSSVYNTATQEYTMTGSGVNMWFDKDAFHFLYKKMKGDFILQFEFSFVGEAKNQHRKVGWMVRNDTTTGSEHINGTVHNDGLTSIQYRPKVGEKTFELKSTAKAPNIIQFERRGNKYILSTAIKGQDFIIQEFVDSAKFIKDEALVGMFICSHEKDTKETAIIRNVRITIPAKADLVQYKEYLGSNLEILDIQTGNRQIIYTAPNSIQAPNWTVDGKSLIYNSDGLLYNFDLASGKPKVIDTKFANKNNNDHVLSFDGKQIGISDQSQHPQKKSMIYILPVGGGTPVQITDKAPSYLHGWSLDAKELIFTGERDGDYDIYSINIKTKVETRLTNSPGLDDGSEFSPDGKFIYFNSVRSGKMQVWRMKPDGSNPERITNDEYNNWFPHVSPDGKWIVYVAFGNDVKPGDHPFYKHVSIRLMNLETREMKILVHLYGGQGTINVPSWSPDGKKIAFVSNTTFNDWFTKCY
jgi:TolB protein